MVIEEKETVTALLWSFQTPKLNSIHCFESSVTYFFTKYDNNQIHLFFLPHCMECRRGLTMRILSVRPSICPSVCLSNACIVTKRKKNLSRFLYHGKEPSFLRRRMVGEGDPSTLNFWSTGPRWSEIADFQPIFARSASAVTLSEKVQLTLIGSLLRAFK